MDKVDEIDIQILDVLQSDGRMRRLELAERVGLSIPSVSDRLRKLEERGLITGFAVRLDARALGFDVTAFIVVQIDTSRHYAGFIERASGHPEVLECHAVTGDGSHLLKIRTRDTKSLERVLSQIQQWPGVHGTRTSIVLSTSKETAAIPLTKPRRRASAA
jgi:Lrp/AsnC family leucine-responsive transcriptional regulator